MEKVVWPIMLINIHYQKHFPHLNFIVITMSIIRNDAKLLLDPISKLVPLLPLPVTLNYVSLCNLWFFFNLLRIRLHGWKIWARWPSPQSLIAFIGLYEGSLRSSTQLLSPEISMVSSPKVEACLPKLQFPLCWCWHILSWFWKAIPNLASKNLKEFIGEGWVPRVGLGHCI